MNTIQHRIRLVIIFAWIPIVGYSQDSTNVKCVFTNTDSSYLFYGTCLVEADINCLMQICFDYDHIRKLAPDAKEVTQVEKGNGWNKIKYVLRYLKTPRFGIEN